MHKAILKQALQRLQRLLSQRHTGLARSAVLVEKVINCSITLYSRAAPGSSTSCNLRKDNCIVVSNSGLQRPNWFTSTHATWVCLRGSSMVCACRTTWVPLAGPARLPNSWSRKCLAAGSSIRQLSNVPPLRASRR